MPAIIMHWFTAVLVFYMIASGVMPSSPARAGSPTR